MGEDEHWFKFVLIYLGWLLAAAGIALVFALFVGQIITFFGIDPASATRRHVTEILAAVFFVILAAIPFLIPRFSRKGTEGEETEEMEEGKKKNT